MKTSNRIAFFWTLMVLTGAAVITYLFATAPVPLDAVAGRTMSMSTEEALTLLAHENDVTRTLFTKAIVGQGKPQGMKFDEDWADPEVVAGPLPALFLRGVASELAASPVPLGLYLGSDFPIEKSNLFEDRQAEEFQAMRKDQRARFFVDPTTSEHIGMFPDFAVAMPCVSCHNEHERTSKTDWKLGDLMGATTWSYPADSVSTDEFLAMLEAYRAGVGVVWSRYLDEWEALPIEDRPDFGPHWPSQGFHLPDLATLRDSIDALASPAIMKGLTKERS